MHRKTRVKLDHRCLEIGAKFVSTDKDPNFCTVELSCGHTQRIRITSLMKNNPRCNSCRDLVINGYCNQTGCKIDTKPLDKSGRYSLIKPCGCSVKMFLSQIASNSLANCNCEINNNYTRIADDKGFDILENIPGSYRIRCKECGAEKTAQKSNLKRRLRCKNCLNNKLNKEAKENGLILLGKADDPHYRRYQLQCGHDVTIRIDAVRNKLNPKCPICNKQKRKRCYLYLLFFEVGTKSYLKIGISDYVERRTKELSGDIKIVPLIKKRYNTKREARSVETAIHRVLRKEYPRQIELKDVLISGYTECYPLTERVVEVFNQLK